MTNTSPISKRDPAVLIGRLLPVETKRRECLNIVADSIELAYRQTPDRWGLTLRPGILRLNVGMIEVLTIKTNVFHCVVDHALVPERLRTDPTVTYSVWRADPDRGTYESVPGSAFVDMDPLTALRVFEEFAPAHHALIDLAARTARNPGTIEGHTPGAIIYLAQYLGRRLPVPIY